MTIGSIKIGDGTAPAGFPAYSAHSDAQHPNGIRCNFNGCGHIGSRDTFPPVMDCGGFSCSCPCCRMLAGRMVFGCTYGGRTVGVSLGNPQEPEQQHEYDILLPTLKANAELGIALVEALLKIKDQDILAADMRSLIQHCWNHSREKDCSYELMNDEQKTLFNSIIIL